MLPSSKPIRNSVKPLRRGGPMYRSVTAPQDEPLTNLVDGEGGKPTDAEGEEAAKAFINEKRQEDNGGETPMEELANALSKAEKIELLGLLQDELKPDEPLEAVKVGGVDGGESVDLGELMNEAGDDETPIQ